MQNSHHPLHLDLRHREAAQPVGAAPPPGHGLAQQLLTGEAAGGLEGGVGGGEVGEIANRIKRKMKTCTIM
ncbi:MAG: hypothetical protein R3B47_02755 [Bacteroidia bacterium]